MKKLAKCGIHGLSFCNTKHDAPQCESCILVKHREKTYIFKNGHKLKYCPHCGEYKQLNEFKKNSQGYLCWCNSCRKEYARNRYQLVEKSFMITHKVNNKKEFVRTNNAVTMIKLVREYLVNNNESIIEIKRL